MQLQHFIVVKKMSKLIPYLEEWELLTNKERAYITNGCGPKFGFLGAIVPDFGNLYTGPCNLHDWIYWSGGSEEMRIYADEQFKKDLTIVNNQLPWWKRWVLSWVPRVYYIMVRRLGSLAWHKASRRRTRHDLRREMRNATL